MFGSLGKYAYLCKQVCENEAAPRPLGDEGDACLSKN